MSEPGVLTLIVERGSLADAKASRDPHVTGWTRCAKCDHGVLLRDDESTKVAAGTWRPLCEPCAQELAAEHPEWFTERVRRDDE